jgi:hypothetical protein
MYCEESCGRPPAGRAAVGDCAAVGKDVGATGCATTGAASAAGTETAVGGAGFAGGTSGGFGLRGR